MPDHFMQREQDLAELNAEHEPKEDDTCANCGRYYDQHLIHDGNKCHTGAVAGWFPRRLAEAIGTCKPKDFSEKPICDRSLPGSYRFGKGFIHCALPFDHPGKCSGEPQ